MVRAMAAERLAIAEAKKAAQERDRAVQAEKRAEEESALVLATNNFLRHELLEQADPGVHADLDQKPDKDIKLRTVLDRAAGRISGAFPDRPELEAAVRRSIGEAYRGLGEYDPARPHLEAAYEVLRKSLGASHPDTLTAQENLANLFRDLGQFDRAEPLLQDALEARRRTLGSDHPASCRSSTTLPSFTGVGGSKTRLSRCSERPWRPVGGLWVPTTLIRSQPRQDWRICTCYGVNTAKPSRSICNLSTRPGACWVRTTPRP